MGKQVKSNQKIRVTLDLSQPFYERLKKLEELSNSDTKASLIRQALQLYEYVVMKSMNGYSFRVVGPEGKEENLVFFDIPSRDPDEIETPT
jgi:hypothetical protein